MGEVLKFPDRPVTDLGELVLLRTYQGDAGQLASSIGELRLIRENDRAMAVYEFARQLSDLSHLHPLFPADIEDAKDAMLEGLLFSDDDAA